MEKFARTIIRFRWLIVIIVLSVTLVLSLQIRNISINSDIISSLPDNDPTALLYKNIGTEFGGNDMGLIVLETNNVFKAEVLRHVRQITDTLRTTRGVSTVTSITNILDIKSSEEALEIGKLVDSYHLPEEQAALDDLASYVLSKEMYRGVIVSEDASATSIYFILFPDSDKEQIAERIKVKIGEMNLPEKVYFGGLPFMMHDINRMIISDILWLMPAVFLVIAFILLLSFRSFKGVLMPLLTAGIAVIWTLGVMIILGFEITIISNIVPVILLAVGSAYTIHVINSIYQSKTDYRTQSLIKSFSHVLIPIILAAATTAVGFVSFVFGSYLTMIKEFGIFAAAGTFFALIISVLFVPALIAIIPERNKKSGRSAISGKGLLTNRFLHPLLKLLFRHPGFVITGWIIVLVISAVGITGIKTNVNMVNYFRKESPTRIAEDILQDKFGGSMPVFVLFEGDMQSPEVLRIMKKTELYMKQNPNIAVTQSISDLIEQMNDAMGEGRSIPDDRARIEQLWFLLEGQDIMSQLVSEDLDKGVIQSKFASIDSKDINFFTSGLTKFIEENSTETCTISLTGMPSVYVRLNESLIRSQFSSLLIAVIMVILIVGVILRSLSKGIVTTVPLLATIMVLLGFMGIAGIPLDIATVLVGSIAVGIGIDYSIHVISGFNNFIIKHGNAEKAIEETILISGKAIIINVTSVAAGFLLLLLSQIVPLQSFGMLVCISMFISGFGAITLLPVMLIHMNKRRSMPVN